MDSRHLIRTPIASRLSSVSIHAQEGSGVAKLRREKIDRPFTDDAEVVEMVGMFERCEWPYSRWTHRAHIGVALCYLQALPFEAALTRARHHIQLYNRTCGDPSGYHETITVLFLRRIRRYLLEHSSQVSLAAAAEELAAASDMHWPLQYYSPERLWSAEARASWLEPDRRPLDF
jgi:hypothetical protein